MMQQIMKLVVDLKKKIAAGFYGKLVIECMCFLV